MQMRALVATVAISLALNVVGANAPGAEQKHPRLEFCEGTVVGDTSRPLKTELTSPPGPAGAEKHRPHRQGDNQGEYVHLSSLHNEERRPRAPPRGLR